MIVLRVGTIQREAIGTYVFDGADELPMYFAADGTLVADAAWSELTEAANSADADRWPQMRSALQAVAHRVLVEGAGR